MSMVFTNCYLSINGVDLSTKVRSVTLDASADPVDATAMGAGGWKSTVGGLKSGKLSVEFVDDFSAGSVDVTTWNDLGNTVPFELRPDTAARSATNPSYSGSVLVEQHNVGGKVGDLASKQLSWTIAGQIQRLTS